MRYFVALDPVPDGAAGTGTAPAPMVVEISELPSGALDVRVDGKAVDVDVVAPGSTGVLSVRVGGRMVDLTTEGSPPDLGAVASGTRAYVRVESERQRAADAAKRVKGGGSEKDVKSPMPGRVVKVLVAPGDEVAAGQPLLVVEAMKMENEVKAKAAGKVGEIHVKAGDTVESGARLVTLS